MSRDGRLRRLYAKQRRDNSLLADLQRDGNNPRKQAKLEKRIYERDKVIDKVQEKVHAEDLRDLDPNAPPRRPFLVRVFLRTYGTTVKWYDIALALVPPALGIGRFSYGFLDGESPIEYTAWGLGFWTVSAVFLHLLPTIFLIGLLVLLLSQAEKLLEVIHPGTGVEDPGPREFPDQK